MLRAALCCALVLLAMPARASSPSPYAGQEGREIKALSPEEISDYLSGKGMGLAKAAELNGYPGPAHVLELAAQLGLTPEQRAATEALFQKMQQRAIALGRELVDAEGALDRLFASRSASSEAVKVSLARIARLQGEIRQAHLVAHIEQAAVLTPEQITTYARLRGYDVAPVHDGRHRH
jgi:Spy/CpxP family protein refolding chaperone